MGQAVSLPVDRREAPIGSPNVRPPSGWSNDEKEQFQPISPVSDVSNPSQFRHRLKPGEVPAPQAAYVTSTRRTSKVVGKTPTRKRHSGKVLNPPDRFYFPEPASTSQHRDTYRQARHSARPTRWKVYKRRLTAKCHEAKKQIGAIGNCCKPNQVVEHVEDHETLGASTPVYNKHEKKVHHQVLNDSLSEAGDELDPVIGLQVDNVSQMNDTSFADYPAVRQHNIDKTMEPYLQFLEAATTSPKKRYDPTDDASEEEDILDTIRRNNTDDSVLLEKTSTATTSSDGSSGNDDLLRARNKLRSIAQFKPVYREDAKENQTDNESEVEMHSLDNYVKRLSNHHGNTKKSISSSESSRYSYDADSSSVEELSRKGRKSEASETTQLTRSTLLAEPSALLKMHLEEAEDIVESPVAALFSRDEVDDLRRVSSGLYSDMNSLIESNGSEQKKIPTGLFSDMGSEIGPEELTYMYSTTRNSMDSQRTEPTLSTVHQDCQSRGTVARVSDFTGSSSPERQPKESLESQGSRRTVIHAVNLPLREKSENRTFLTSKKNSLDSQKTTNTVILAEPLPLPRNGRNLANRETRVSHGSSKDSEHSETGKCPRASNASNSDQRENRLDAELKQKNTTRESCQNGNIARVSDVQLEHVRTSSTNAKESIKLEPNSNFEENTNGIKARTSSEQPKSRPSFKTSRRSSTAGRESLQMPALLQLAGWKDTGRSSAKDSQKLRIDDQRKAVEVDESQDNDDEGEGDKQLLEIKRRSDPLPATKTTGTTAADMLRQSYPFFAQLREAETSERRLTTQSAPASSGEDYRLLALGASGRFAEKNPLSIASQSPCLSVDSIPMLSNQVLGNAALLFSPSYLNGTELTGSQKERSQPSGTGAVSLNTLGSRGRALSVVSRDPVSIPARPKAYLDPEVASKQSEKRVRFSDIMNLDQDKEVQPSSVEIPPIRHKLSDLSDTTGLEPYRPSISSIRESIAPIPEESTQMRPAYWQNGIPEESSQTRWAYAQDAGLDSGVTPLRSGKTATYSTNSPLLRFQEARTKFSGAASIGCIEETKQSETMHTQGRRTKGSIVSARVAEMEEKSSKAQSAQVAPPKTEMTTTASNVYLFEEESGAEKMIKSANSIWRPRPNQVEDTERSPTLVNGNFVGSNDKAEAAQKSISQIAKRYDTYRSFEVGSDYGDALDTILNPMADNRSEVSSGGESLRDLFKTHKANIEEDSSNEESQSDDDEDDFESMLNYQQDLSEETSVDDETVSTIRQDRSKRFGGQFASYRMSVGGASVASSATGDTVSTIKQNRFSIASTNSSKLMKWEQPSLPFRKHAPVKPTEQAVHSTSGVLTLSPHNKTPAQARKWRDLAAAAQERNSNRKVGDPSQGMRSNLGERSVNVFR